LNRFFSLELIQLTTFCDTAAAAEVRQFQNAPGQMLYKSQWTLRDQFGKTWQAIAFQRSQANEPLTIGLRLVGFPGSVDLDLTQPLTLSDRLGQYWQAEPLMQPAFFNFSTQNNVNQFDLQPILLQFQPQVPLHLTLATVTGDAIELRVPPFLVEEWQKLIDRQ
jgi:hypothetical protein